MSIQSSGGPVCVCVINMKGGVGKTTVAVLLARYAAQRLGRKVLAIDLDPQANLSQALMSDRYDTFLEDRAPSIAEIFKGYLPPVSGSTGPESLDDVAIETNERNVHLIASRFDFSGHLVEDMRRTDSLTLARYIFDKFRDRDLIIIDCTPTESVFTRVAYHASRYVLVPVRPEYFATIGFPLLQRSLDSFRRENQGHRIDVLGIAINNVRNKKYEGPEQRRSMVEIRDEAKKNGWCIFKNKIPYSRGFPKMMRGDYSYSGNAPKKFNRFAKEFFERLDAGVKR